MSAPKSYAQELLDMEAAAELLRAEKEISAAAVHRSANASGATQVGEAIVTPDTVEFRDVPVDKHLTVDSPMEDYADVFEFFGLSPQGFEIIDDTFSMTVRKGTHQQSRRTDDGDRDVIELSSKRWTLTARFRKRPLGRLSDVEVAERTERLRKYKLPRRIPGNGLGPVVAVQPNLADIQGGKTEGGGVKATEQRLLDGLENLQAYIRRQRKFGVNLDEIALANNGDPGEGCAGNYATQLFSVEMNHRQQMNWVLDMWEVFARELFPQFETAQFISVLCNHGEMGRFGGGRNQTDDSDNLGGFLAETLRRTLAGRSEFDHVKWTIPHDEMTVYPSVAGIPMAFTHGHKIPGEDAKGFEKWLNGQVRGDDRAHKSRIWVTAHRHHFAQWDMGKQWVFQCPSLDGGSKWLRDMTGRWANSGMLVMTVGEHHPMGWSDVAFC